MITDESPPPKYSVDNNGVVTRKSGTKKASLFAWTTLQSIPEETIISPHILEFLEQTLAPIPQMNTSPFPSAGKILFLFLIYLINFYQRKWLFKLQKSSTKRTNKFYDIT